MDRQNESSTSLAQQEQESEVDTPETSQCKTLMAERGHQETFLGGNVNQSLSVDHYEEMDIYENENRADVRTASAPALAEQAQESGVDTPETSQCKTLIAEREHQETFLGGNVSQSLSVDHYEEVDIHENENCAAVRTASAPALAKQAQESGVDTPETSQCKTIMAEREYQETCRGDNARQSFNVDHYEKVDIYENENCAAVRTANAPVVLQTRLSENNGQNHSELRDKIKKNGLKWLVVSFVLAAFIITWICLTAFMHSEDQKAKILLENLKKTIASRIDEVHGEDQNTNILLENLNKSLTSRIDKLHVKDKDNHTALLLENLQKNLTSSINKTHGEDQKTKILLNNLKKPLTNWIHEVFDKNQQMKTNFEVWKKNLSSFMDISLQHSLNLSAMHEVKDLLERQIQELNSTALRLQNKVADVQCQDGFHYLSKCYFAIIREREDIWFYYREYYCRSRGGGIGNVLNLDHQILIEYYVRPKIPAAQNRTQMWIGTIYEYTYSGDLRANLTTTDGYTFPADSIRWHSSYPRPVPDLWLQVHKDPSIHTGALNTRADPWAHSYGVFCEK